MVNQGMRAWVTACDNVLDDEYKEIFDFQTMAEGPKMRSILTVMLAERVISSWVIEEYNDLVKRARQRRLTAGGTTPISGVQTWKALEGESEGRGRRREPPVPLPELAPASGGGRRVVP